MRLANNRLRQAAVIAVYAGRVCLVQSSSRKRWVVPKGCIESGQSASETALQEAWEEAGLVGTLQQDPVGSYLYKKAGVTFHVTVFFMNVIEVADTWPEDSRRLRRWVPAPTAANRIVDAGLRKLIRRAFSVASSRRSYAESK